MTEKDEELVQLSQQQIQAEAAKFLRRHSFRKNNIRWVWDPKQDEEVIDCKNQKRIIKRYVPIPLGKDYRKIKEQKKIEQGQGDFVVETSNT